MLKRSVIDLFSYEILPPSGGSKTKKKGNTADLLLGVPQLFVSKIIPGERVINGLLESGICDAGMSGGLKWEPFSFPSDEFSTLIEQLLLRNESLTYIEYPNWVEDIDDWNIWVMDYAHGIPWEKHKALNDQYLAIIKDMNAAYESGENEKASMLHIESIEVGDCLAQYIMEHTKS